MMMDSQWMAIYSTCAQAVAMITAIVPTLEVMGPMMGTLAMAGWAPAPPWTKETECSSSIAALAESNERQGVFYAFGAGDETRMSALSTENLDLVRTMAVMTSATWWIEARRVGDDTIRVIEYSCEGAVMAEMGVVEVELLKAEHGVDAPEQINTMLDAISEQLRDRWVSVDVEPQRMAVLDHDPRVLADPALRTACAGAVVRNCGPVPDHKPILITYNAPWFFSESGVASSGDAVGIAKTHVPPDSDPVDAFRLALRAVRRAEEQLVMAEGSS